MEAAEDRLLWFQLVMTKIAKKEKKKKKERSQLVKLGITRGQQIWEQPQVEEGERERPNEGWGRRKGGPRWNPSAAFDVPAQRGTQESPLILVAKDLALMCLKPASCWPAFSGCPCHTRSSVSWAEPQNPVRSSGVFLPYPSP